MTEFEAATITFQNATLAYQFYSLVIAGGIGLLQCALIGGGLLMMYKAGNRRDRQLDAITENLSEQSAGIRALLERPAQ